MTIKEIMERAGMTKTGIAIHYIKDGLDEIARTVDDNVQTDTQDILKGTREYDFPDDMVTLRKILVKNSEGNMEQIPRLTHGPTVEK